MNQFNAYGGEQYNAPGGTITIGTPPEELSKLATALASLSQLSAGQQAEIGRLSERLETSEGIVRRVLATLGEHASDIALEELPARVAELVAIRRKSLERQIDQPIDPDAVIAKLDRALNVAVAAGDDRSTQALLEQKRDLKLATAERLRAAWERDLREAAETEADLGELARAQLRYRDAATHFRAAAEMLPGDTNREMRFAFLDRAADALYRQGSDFGDNAALFEAIDQYKALLRHRPRNDLPLDWAMTQNNLGVALQTLGERESGTARLEEAVAAYRAALEERTRDRVPLDWAMTKANLALARAQIADRGGSGGEEASDDIDAALAVLREAGAVAYVDWAEGVRRRIKGQPS